MSKWRPLQTLWMMTTSFAENHCLSSWLIVDTPLISKLFTSFVPICSQFRVYICYLGEFVKNETHRFQCFSANDVIIKRVFLRSTNGGTIRMRAGEGATEKGHRSTLSLSSLICLIFDRVFLAPHSFRTWSRASVFKLSVTLKIIDSSGWFTPHVPASLMPCLHEKHLPEVN